MKTDANLLQTRPWRQDAKYFQKVYISSIAVYKMAKHAVAGGNIEIMGSLMGKVGQNCIVVTDVFGIPVEGTETRVNAQIEGYEYMVSYLQSTNQVHPDDHIVGWYHSHPGYGCWLSGIDVSTQSLNQIQDPYLAIVIDPFKSLKMGKIDIGAFRTYPETYKNDTVVSEATRAKFGNYSDKYYSLDIEIYNTELDEQLIKFINKETWINELIDNKDINSNVEHEKLAILKDITKSLQEGHKEDEAQKADRHMSHTQFNHLLNAGKQTIAVGKERRRKDDDSDTSTEGVFPRVTSNSGTLGTTGVKLKHGKRCYDSMMKNSVQLSNIELHSVSKSNMMSRLFN